nr:hypothetical protein [uncultured Halomonas sp.]
MKVAELVEDVIADLPGAPLVTVRRALLDATRELCTRADVWVSDDVPVIVAAQSGYPQVISPDGGEVLRIRRVTVDGETLRPGIDYEQPRADSVRMLRKPAASTLYGEVASRPPMTATRLPDALIRYREAIADGARYRLMQQPNKEWSQPSLASYYLQRFELAINDANQHATHGHARGSRRVKPRRFI